MFTHVKPTIRHIAPDNLQGRAVIKVVYVVLESQYQSAISTAVRSINKITLIWQLKSAAT